MVTNYIITGDNSVLLLGKYPLLCGQNSGHHIYLNVEGRASTDLTFILNNLQEQLYNCPDKFNVLDLEPEAVTAGDSETMRAFSNPTVNINGEYNGWGVQW